MTIRHILIFNRGIKQEGTLHIALFDISLVKSSETGPYLSILTSCNCRDDVSVMEKDIPLILTLRELRAQVTTLTLLKKMMAWYMDLDKYMDLFILLLFIIDGGM